jgi:hypothetical protein
MVLRITVIPEQWSIVTVINRESMNTFLRGVISTKLERFDDCEKTIISLPRTTTKSQRHNIHRLTCSGFVSLSYDNQFEDRIIEITLEKIYVEALFQGYTFAAQHVTVQVDPPSEKQRMFDLIIGFVNEHFPHELEQFIDSM